LLAGNREFFCDQSVSLLLLYFFSPVITSLHALREASELEKVQKLLGINRVSTGTLSESAGVFDPAPLQGIIGELAGRAVPLSSGRQAEALAGTHGGRRLRSACPAADGAGLVGGADPSRGQVALAFRCARGNAASGDAHAGGLFRDGRQL
jgi:hypothetical protein